MKFKILALAALTVSTLMGCSVKSIPIDSTLAEVDISGQWAILDKANWQNEVMFDFRNLYSTDFQLKVWGKDVNGESIQLQNDQFLFSYETYEGRTFSVLGQVLSPDKIKLSRVEGKLSQFQPVGKLGEQVYHLQRLNEGEPHMLTAAPSKKSRVLRYK